jgi:RNA recognition motif-containing protein
MKLLVRNLARSISEDDLRSLFEVHGIVQSCNIVMDTETGASKGFGFVNMPKSGQAKAAMKELNGTEWDDQKIRVKKADLPKQEK